MIIGIVHLCSQNTVCSKAVPSEDESGLFVCPISGLIIKPHSLDLKLRRRTYDCNNGSENYQYLNECLSEIYVNTILDNQLSEQFFLYRYIKRVCTLFHFSRFHSMEPDEGERYCWEHERKRQRREGYLCFAEPEESGAINEEDVLPGFFGRCFIEGSDLLMKESTLYTFLLGYECLTEKELDM